MSFDFGERNIQNPLHLKILSDSHSAALDSLRDEAYRARYGDGVDTRALRWNPALKNTLNLGLFEGDNLISAYRLDHVADSAQAEFCLQSSAIAVPELGKLSYPIVVGCRACTRVDRQKEGHHFTLRLAAIEILMALEVRFLASTFDGDSGWVPHLSEIGYSIFKSDRDWSDFLKNKSRPSIAILDLEKNGKIGAEILRAKQSQPVHVNDELLPSKSWPQKLLLGTEAGRAWSRLFASSSPHSKS